MSAETEISNMQAGIQQLLPDITRDLTALSLLHRPPQSVNAHHPHHPNMQPNGKPKFLFCTIEKSFYPSLNRNDLKLLDNNLIYIYLQ